MTQISKETINKIIALNAAIKRLNFEFVNPLLLVLLLDSLALTKKII